MTVEDFEKLSEQDKKVQLFEARKVTERQDSFSKFELFYIDNFFVESKTSKLQLFKRTIKCYSLKDLPLAYAGSLKILWS